MIMSPNSPPDHYCKQLLIKKLTYAVFSTFAAQTALLVIFSIALNFNPLRPVESLHNATLTTPWLPIAVPFVVAILAQAVLCSKQYVAKKTFCRNRFEKLMHAVGPKNLSVCGMEVVAGSLLMWVYFCVLEGEVKLSLDGFRNVVVFCDGVVVGLWFYGGKGLEFPVVQQKKFLQVKARLVALCLESKSEAFWPSVYVCCFFCFGGRYFFEGNIEGFWLCFSLFVLNSVYVFSKNLTDFFFTLHLTEAVEFDLDVQSGGYLKLQEGIIMDSVPIIQNLACLDLYLLSYFSKNRREVLYSVSTPGGHPHNWDSLKRNILQLFKNYTDTLNASIDQLLPSEAPAANKLPPKPHIVHQPSPKPLNIRNASLTLNDPINILNSTPSSPPPQHTVKPPHNPLLATIKRRLGYDYLFRELPADRIRHCLTDEGKVILWAAQGVSWLCTASLTEDRYGVVQGDLGEIVAALAGLKRCLDRVTKVGAFARRQDGFGWRMRAALASAVRRSLVNICHGFRDYLGEFAADGDVSEVLKSHTPVK